MSWGGGGEIVFYYCFFFLTVFVRFPEPKSKKPRGLRDFRCNNAQQIRINNVWRLSPRSLAGLFAKKKKTDFLDEKIPNATARPSLSSPVLVCKTTHPPHHGPIVFFRSSRSHRFLLTTAFSTSDPIRWPYIKYTRSGSRPFDTKRLKYIFHLQTTRPNRNQRRPLVAHLYESTIH